MAKINKIDLKLPHVGMRTIKTVVAVFLTALFMRYVMDQTPFFACVGAVVAMEKTITQSFQAAIIRNLGTILGGLIGIAIASFTSNIFIISLGVIPLIYISGGLGRKESIVPGAIVYFAVVYLNTMDLAWFYGLTRILGTFIGSLIGLAVNFLIFPPPKEFQL